MRFVIGVVLALSVGIGAYLGSAQVADSAKTPPRRVTLRIGDVAALGQIQCRATAWTRQHPTRTSDAYLRCSKGPLSRAAASVAVYPWGVLVGKKVGHVQCFWQAPGPGLIPPRTFYFSASLSCNKGPNEGPRRGHIDVSVEVLPGRIAVLKDDRRVVYRTGWDPG
jgi:hypothetical protein